MEALFAFTDGDVWRPGIGDPTVMGWVTVAAYFVAAFLCLRHALSNSKKEGISERTVFWVVLTAFLIFLGFNKQLDLQTLLTLTGRKIFIALGLYDYRRVVQAIFVLFVGLAGVAGVLLMRGLVRRHNELKLPLFGFVLLVTFLVIRAASFHHMDQLINFRFAGVRMNWALEIGSLVILAVGAARAQKDSAAAGETRPFATA